MTKFRMPTAYTILFSIIIVMAVMTWIIPSGQYDYTESDSGTSEPIAGSYHSVAPDFQGAGDVILSSFEGFYSAVDICIFILMVGGFLGVIMKTGAVDAGIENVISALNGREKIMIPVLMVLFGLGGTTYGMWEETMAFYPLLVPVFIMAGFDSISAVAVIVLGAGIGTLCSTVNPFATGIASGFAGISVGDGIVLRVIMFIILETIAIIYVLRYAAKIEHNPQRSVTSDLNREISHHFLGKNKKEHLREAEAITPEDGLGEGSLIYETAEEIVVEGGLGKSHKRRGSKGSADAVGKLTGSQKTVLVIFAITFIIMIYSVIPFEDFGLTFLPTLGWWFPELSGLFLTAGIAAGLCAGLKETKLAESFIAGAADLLGVAFIIGISRGITVIMNNGKITDTILHWGEAALSGAGSVVFIWLIYILYIPLSFFIPSTSGLATLSIPIMAPLGQFAGVAGSLIVTSFQSASGLVNLITPTSAVIMGALAIGRVPYERWIKFVWKFLLIVFGITLVILTIATIMK